MLDRLLTRIEKRIDPLKRVKLAGCEVAIAEREFERNLPLRARRYPAWDRAGRDKRNRPRIV